MRLNSPCSQRRVANSCASHAQYVAYREKVTQAAKDYIKNVMGTKLKKPKERRAKNRVWDAYHKGVMDSKEDRGAWEEEADGDWLRTKP